MTNKKSCYLAALALSVAVCSCGTASAKDSGVYLGVTAGQSHFDVGDVSSGITGLPASFTKDESDTALSFSLGYRFNPFIAIEGAYADYGKATISSTNSFDYGGITFNTLDSRIAVNGGFAAVIGAIPAGDWEFSLKLGAFFANTKVTAHVGGMTDTSPTQLVDDTESESASTVETLAGVGVGYTIANHYHFKAEWTRIPKVGDKEKTGEGDVTSLTLGLQYRF